jgi:hypothetical protein
MQKYRARWLEILAAKLKSSDVNELMPPGPTSIISGFLKLSSSATLANSRKLSLLLPYQVVVPEAVVLCWALGIPAEHESICGIPN